MNSDSNIDLNIGKLEADITDLINKELENNSVLLGITIGTHDGSLIASLHKSDSKLSNLDIASANSSILFLSSKMLKDSLNQKISHNLIASKNTYLLSILTNSITLISYLNREFAELEGLNNYIKKLKNFALKITAIVETSELIKEEIFVSIKRAIPNTLLLAIITKDGLPIKIQSTMPEPIISAMISAVFNLSEVLIDEGGVEYSIIAGKNGSIIMHELYENRILAIAVPETDDTKLGAYIAKIKTIIK